MRQVILVSGLILIIAGLGITGCKSNPYPDQGQYSVNKPVEKTPLPPYGLSADDVVQFVEGIQGQVRVRGWVEAPGKPVFTFENLPSGATYDPVKSVISWTPSFDSGNDPGDQTSIEKTYVVTVRMSSTVTPTVALTKNVTLIVRDAPRSFTLKNFVSDATFNEGEGQVIDIQISNGDFPTGKFRLFPTAMPQSAVLAEDPADATHFTVTYTSDFKVSNREQNNDINWTLQIVDPRNRVLNVPIRWHIQDVRQNPVVRSPSSLSIGSEVSFMIYADDPNGEEAPDITVDAPPYGLLSVVPTSMTPRRPPSKKSSPRLVESPSTLVMVNWKSIPTSTVVRHVTLVAHVCVFGSYNTKDQCLDQPIDVTIAATTPPRASPPPPMAMSHSAVQQGRLK